MKRHVLLFLAVGLLLTGAGRLFAAQEQEDAVK
jgi:hypothetical protein